MKCYFSTLSYHIGTVSYIDQWQYSAREAYREALSHAAIFLFFQNMMSVYNIIMGKNAILNTKTNGITPCTPGKTA